MLPNVIHELSALDDTTHIDFFSPSRDDMLKYARIKKNAGPTH